MRNPVLPQHQTQDWSLFRVIVPHFPMHSKHFTGTFTEKSTTLSLNQDRTRPDTGATITLLSFLSKIFDS